MFPATQVAGACPSPVTSVRGVRRHLLGVFLGEGVDADHALNAADPDGRGLAFRPCPRLVG
jgi:hypothetical protein